MEKRKRTKGTSAFMRDQAVAHSLALLRDAGYRAEVVEKSVPTIGPTYITKDLFGIIDILAVRTAAADASLPGFLGVQVTTRNGRSEHRKTILDSAASPDWLAAGGRIQIHSWFQQEVATSDPKAKNPTKTVWDVIVDEILPIHLDPESL